tara:strand:- start:134 stop:373 length:240 start_codon:yes stop_codon:yes gene_type:complete
MKIDYSKKHFITLTESEMDLLSIMLEQESGRASNMARYATSFANDYGYKDELKSIWKKVIKAVDFPYSLKSKYDNQNVN